LVLRHIAAGHEPVGPVDGNRGDIALHERHDD
jgi:hypothetical protein